MSKETDVDTIITETIRQCVEQGVLKDTGLAIDCTHSEANTIKKVPERIMKHLAKDIIRSLAKEKKLDHTINIDIPDYKEIADEKEAKRVMLEYLTELIESAKVLADGKTKRTSQSIAKAEKIIEDPKFIRQKGVRSLIDTDARVGHKTRDDSFFGYKTEFTMLPDERIITAIEAHDGAYVDGTDFEKLFEQSGKCGLYHLNYYGDKAYFRLPILNHISENHGEAFIPVSEMCYRIDETKFSYNKDSDQWFCHMGNHTVKKVYEHTKYDRKRYRFTFDKKQCINCPVRQECAGKAKSRTFYVGINAADYYEHSQKAKTVEFKESYRKRASIEWKNGETKRFHGMAKCKGYNLRSVNLQVKFTAIAVNLKRIAAIVLASLFAFYQKGLFSKNFSCKSFVFC